MEPSRYPWQQTLSDVPIPAAAADVDGFIGALDDAGVAAAVLVQPSTYGWDNSYLCDSVERFPGRLVGICLVDYHSPDAADDLTYWCRRRSCQGLRINLIGDPEPALIVGAHMRELWTAVARLDITLSFQIRPAMAEYVAEICGRLSDVQITLDYLGRDAFFDSGALAAVDLLAESPNLHAKLMPLGVDSGLEYPYPDILPLSRHIIDRFGPRRVIFGSDYPYVRDCCGYRSGTRWLGEVSGLSAADLRRVTDTNARGLWRFG